MLTKTSKGYCRVSQTRSPIQAILYYRTRCPTYSTLFGNHPPPPLPFSPTYMNLRTRQNVVRILLDNPHYHNKTLSSHNRGTRIHVGLDHCLNRIRQIIQCHMDLTPAHTLYFPEMNTDVGDFDQVHQHMVEMENSTEPASPDKDVSNDGKGHRQGYLKNGEMLLPWDTTWREFS
ncbi:hypothetical protein P280DRAFT_12240 [Massarina eburnea CBS 473.64]|uniref:Uncharacterized protein n=1 Tax=Massarina eburnea CBS 473.64 TaxID=1395130 RepID=A0A6A6SF06_9PLEO|nr:hypothetical protein P280DRAFT_12240 [Massarina eburnea CBS 473.64]